jgi:AcrR family transcriptional regulator
VPALPVQKRSRARREAILDAAADEFAARGVGGTTMETIAAAAGSSIGAVYRFFPDRAAIFGALGERCLERSEAFFAATVNDALVELPWRLALAETLRRYAFFYHSEPSFRAVWRNLSWAESYARADLQLRKRYATLVGRLLQKLQPRLTRGRARRIGALVVEVTTAVLMAQAEPRAEPLFDELGRALERYLAPELESP